MNYSRSQINQLAAYNYAANTRVSENLSVRATYWQQLLLSLRGTLTISAVTVPGTPHPDGPANLLQTVEVKIDGETVKLAAGASLLRMAQLYYKTLGTNDGIYTGAAGVYPFHALIPVMFAMPDSVNPPDSYEDGTRVKNLTVNITFGDTTSLITGNTSTLALTATSCEIYLQDTEANFQRQNGIWRFRQFEATQQGILTSGSTRLQVPSVSKGGVVRTLLLAALDATVPSDTIINAVNQLKINGAEEVPFNTVEDDFLQALSTYEQQAPAMVDGYYPFEFADRGRVLTTGLGAFGKEVKSIDVFCDTTVGVGATSVRMHVAEMVPR